MLKVFNTMSNAERNNYTMQHILNAFKAFVEAIIPWTPKLAQEYGEIQYYGAIDLLTYEYLIQSLYEFGGISLIIETAKRLDAEAEQLILQGNNRYPPNPPEEVVFSALVPSDRLLVINLIKQGGTSSPLDQVAAGIYYLIRLTMLGYYSEWYGYGSTRLREPNERVFEFIPLSWQQVGYTGPRRN